MTPSKNNLTFVTGLSGAGLSSVLKTLEDFGYEVFDNFPLDLVETLLKQTPKDTKIAIGIDARTRGFEAKKLCRMAKTLGATILYITCDENILHRRFTETRRRHPLARNKPVREGVQQEQALLKPLHKHAGITIDTTKLSIHDLRHILEGHFKNKNDSEMLITVLSFSYKGGLPREADIVMDVRFLKNPHWNPDLKPLTGKDKNVGDYIEQDPDFAAFYTKLKNLCALTLPRYRAEGKTYLTIALGCTGGRHRSVYVAEKLGKWLKSKDHNAHIQHRDLPV